MNITAIAGSALSSAFDRFNNAAAAVSQSVSPSDSGDMVDFSAAAVELSMAKIQAEAEIHVFKMARELEQQTIDLFG
jgi:hypothetical protein